MILKISLIIGILIYFCIILHFVKNNKIYLKYAILWLFLGVVLFIFALFPKLLTYVMRCFGISEPLNGLFAFLFLFLFLFLICLLVTITRLNNSNRKLVQIIAILQKKIEELEKHD